MNNAATAWFRFDPGFIASPMEGEWCLWSFMTKHGREYYSGRWIKFTGQDLIVTDRGWSTPLVIGEAYFARLIPMRSDPQITHRFEELCSCGDRFAQHIDPTNDRAIIGHDSTDRCFHCNEVKDDPIHTKE